MRLLVLSLLVAMSSLAAAGENPPYACDGKPGCVQETSGPYDIGAGVLLDLPAGWTLLAYPQPQISELKLREIRAFKGEVVIAITPFPNLDRRTVTEAFLRDLLEKSAAQYVGSSKEQAIATTSLTHDGVVGSMVSFTSGAGADRPFKVLANRRHASVSTLIFSHRFVIFSVSVASETEPDDDYRAAIAAFRNIK